MVIKVDIFHTEGTIFEKNLLTNSLFRCIECNKINACIACELCLKLGLEPRRFCSETCFHLHPEIHTELHASVSGRGRKLANELIANTKKIIIRQGSVNCTPEDLQPLLDNEAKLVEQIDILRYGS
jgi:hypothetical protein